MIQERIPFSEQVEPAFYRHHGTHPLYIDLEPIVQSWQESCPPMDAGNLRSWHWRQMGRKGLDETLRKLSEKDLIDRSYVEEYLRDMYRRQCRPSTLRQALTAVDNFLALIKGMGKNHLEEISRADLAPSLSMNRTGD